MTGQIPDVFRYEGEVYDLVGLDGTGLFTPESFGIDAFSSCTACWRGYVMYYDCIDGKLILDKMEVNAREPIEVNGVKPVKEQNFFTSTYNNLGLKTDFTGTLLLAKDFIQGMYVHMGFQRPIAYRTVLQISILDGDITLVEDLSKHMEQKRQEDPDRDAQPTDPSEVGEWIEKTFSLDFDPTDNS